MRADVPETELVRYAIELRSITSGLGSFTRRFSRYEPMPHDRAEKVLAEAGAGG